jgi:multidrug resistance efflux pump
MSQYNEKIPIPAKLRWREIRVRFFPLLIFVLIAGVVMWLWQDRVEATNMIGRVVGKQAEVRSPQPGSLADLTVSAFDPVSAGDVVARLVTTDPQIMQAELAVVLAQIELIRISRDPFVDLERNLLNYESMQVDLMENRARLGIARIRKQQAQREYERLESMDERGLTAVEMLERARSEYEALQEEVLVIEELVGRLQARLDRFDLERVLDRWDESDPVAAALKVHERTLERIEAEMMPVVLRAPITGQVAQVYRLNGEYVDQGDTIIRIQSPQPDYILGHVRHPLFIQPEPGMQVLVRKQGRDRSEAIMEIESVGVHMETVEQFTSLFPERPFETTGLPVRVALSSELSLRPGEVVDMRLMHR